MGQKILAPKILRKNASESDPFRDYSHCVLVFRRMDFLTEAIFRRSSENAPGSTGRKPGAD
jgi:hypothetical protein